MSSEKGLNEGLQVIKNTARKQVNLGKSQEITNCVLRSWYCKIKNIK